MKLTSIAIFALGLLPPCAIAGLTSNPASGWTPPSSPGLAELPPAPGTGTPDNGHRTLGGTRPGDRLTKACKQTAQPLTAFVPEKSNQSLTASEYPVFWFYIPYTAEDVQSIEFSMHKREDEDKATFYQTSLQLTKTPGVVGIPLPRSLEYSLKPNQTYHWYLKINCDPQKTPENEIVLDGWVTRVQQSPNLVGVIWYDELTNRAKRYLSESQNPEVKKAWVQLLNSVGLQGLAQASVLTVLQH